VGKALQDKATWRRQLRILVPEAHALGAIAGVRSLGRAGYQVHACDADPKALGLRSNFAAAAVVCPSYRDPAYVDWLQNYVRDESISLIIPSEAFLHAIAPAFESFSPLMHISPDPSVVYRSFSKIDVTELLLSAPKNDGILRHLPPTLVVRRGDPLPAAEALRELGTPIYLKSDVKYSSGGSDAFLLRVDTPDQARNEISRALDRYEALLVQGFVPGSKMAAAFCLKDGQVLASSGVLGLRTNPHTGGMMSLRVSSRNERLHASALAWLRMLKWEGVAMVECKWDPASDRYWLIEFNTRYWGYLHLDLFSGIDMPTIQADAFFGAPVSDPPAQVLGVVARHTVPGDSSYLLSLLRDKHVRLRSKVAATLRFGLDFLDPSIHSDLLFPGDRKLYWLQWYRFVTDLFRS
jgi:hypothetical protein